jgi:CDGSH-type Zn-finger protein
MTGCRIVVGENGPYRVEGDPPPLLRTAMVETEYGEPIEWDEGPAFQTHPQMELCRCGGSSRKPFCDSTHERNGFDGTETADRAPSTERREAWPGDGVVMTDDRSFCTQAGFCGDRFTNVWEMIGTDDPEVRDRLRGMISRCPSGRLAYSSPPDGTDVEPAFDASIGVEPNGPLWVRGGVPVVSESGEPYEVRNRQTLCRCGRSRNKPFCDGSHKVVAFTDPATPA